MCLVHEEMFLMHEEMCLVHEEMCLMHEEMCLVHEEMFRHKMSLKTAQHFCREKPRKLTIIHDSLIGCSDIAAMNNVKFC